MNNTAVYMPYIVNLDYDLQFPKTLVSALRWGYSVSSANMTSPGKLFAVAWACN